MVSLWICQGASFRVAGEALNQGGATMKMQALDCPKCGAGVQIDSKFCPHCGSGLILSDDRIRFYLVGAVCPYCQADNQEHDRYCGRCGEPLRRSCPRCFENVPVASTHCNACGIEIEPWREELRIQAKHLQERVNFKRAVQYGLIPLGITGVFVGFYAGGMGILGGIALALFCRWFYQGMRDAADEVAEELDSVRNAVDASEIG
jgi:hypothetical protein